MSEAQQITTAIAVNSEAALVPTAKGADYWIEHYEGAIRFCTGLIRSGFLGQHIKTPEQAVMIMMAGDDLGLPPTVAFRDLHVIHGQIGMKARLMLALVRRSPVCKYFRSIGEPTAQSATFETLRAGAPEPERRTFTIADAQQAGYVSQNAKYKTDPKAMLSARCISILCDLVYSDVTRGMRPAEVLEDEEPEARAVTAPDVVPLTAAPKSPAAKPAPATSPGFTGDEAADITTHLGWMQAAADGAALKKCSDAARKRWPEERPAAVRDAYAEAKARIAPKPATPAPKPAEKLAACDGSHGDPTCGAGCYLAGPTVIDVEPERDPGMEG